MANNKIKVGHRTFEVRHWVRSMPPLLGKHLALDTETELIVAHHKIPAVVLMQVCNGKIIDLVQQADIPEYLTLSEQLSPQATWYMFNVGFDYFVTNKHPTLTKALEEGRLIDLQLRARLYDLKDQGDSYRQSLAELCAKHLGVTLSKEEAVRTGFKVGQFISVDQLTYAAKDAAATFMLAEVLPPMPTEELQTRAAVALRQVEINGIPVDRKRFKELKSEYEAKLAELAFNLKQWGYIIEDSETWSDIAESINELLGAELDLNEVSTAKILLMATLINLTEDASSLSAKIVSFMEGDLKPVQGKLVKWLTALLEPWTMTFLATSKNLTVLLKCARVLIKTRLTGGTPEDAYKALVQLYTDNNGFVKENQKGPQQVLREQLERIERQYNVRLQRTATGKISANKSSLANLKELNLKDTFLDLYLEAKSCELSLGLFFKEWLITEDGRIHPHFDLLKKTGRVSCSNPNMQQLPKDGKIRSMYAAPAGYVLVAIDYHQVELCALAQDCYTRQGKSRMRDLINAGIDLHRWFAARTLGLITDENDFVDYAQVPEDKRQLAKASNFGFPGGMTAKRFLEAQRVAGNFSLTLEMCEELRNKWFEAYPECVKHLECEQHTMDKKTGEPLFMVETLTGRIRSNCSRTEAANTKFQGLAADGSKRALWRLYRENFHIINYIHDEFLLLMKEDDQLTENVKKAEEIMIAEMRAVIPDVVIKVESALMRRWDKKAKSKLENGKLTIWED